MLTVCRICEGTTLTGDPSTYPHPERSQWRTRNVAPSCHVTTVVLLTKRSKCFPGPHTNRTGRLRGLRGFCAAPSGISVRPFIGATFPSRFTRRKRRLYHRVQARFAVDTITSGCTLATRSPTIPMGSFHWTMYPLGGRTWPASWSDQS